MEIEETVLRLLDFFLFEKEWPSNFTGLHLSEVHKAVKEFAEIYDLEIGDV